MGFTDDDYVFSVSGIRRIKMAHYLTKPMVDRLYKVMKSKGISTNHICKLLGVNFKQWMQTVCGDVQMYNKWQTKIANDLGTTREELFKEFWTPQI